VEFSVSSTNQDAQAVERRLCRLTVECIPSEAAGAFIAEWRDLVGRCLEPNAFLEPAFALAAARHLGDGRRLRFLFVWDWLDNQRRGALLGICPIRLPARFAPVSFVRVWAPAHATLGTPLLDRERARDALDAILGWRCETLPNVVGLLFPLVPLDGAFVEALRARASAHGCSVSVLDSHSRAVLRHGTDSEQFFKRAVSPKRRKALRRSRRRLETKGRVTIQLWRDPHEVGAALENFLMLEEKGWKGKRGTALAMATRNAAFVREMTANLSKEEKCRIISLDLDGQPIAMGVLLISLDRAFFWKIAYDESFAEFSPGVQLTLELTKALLTEKRIVETDSCACANHPMIDHIWSEKMAMGDVFVCLGASRSTSFGFAIAREMLRRQIRSCLKGVLNRWRHFMRSRARRYSRGARRAN